MAIKINAREQYLKVGKVPGYYYVMLPELYTALSKDKVIKEAAIRSGVSEGVMSACWDAAGEVIKAWATEGHSVALPGLGTMRFTVRSKAVADVNDVKTNLIKSRRIVFTPATEVKDELAKTAIQITCFDRNGVVVKRVTSTSGEVEDGEENNGSSGSENSGSSSTGSEQGGSSGSSGSNSGTSGSGGTSGTITAPVISGTTPFDDSTQVTISGPAGATIKYTTNGVAPTATYGNDYEEPITLNASATVKAVAIIDGVASEVATKAFVKNGSQGGSGEEGM